MSIILAILIFGAIIVIHEWGHFLAARLNKITVLEFAIGMGPAFYKRKMKSGTLFTLRLFPIGGFCKMLGEDESNEDPGAFNNKKVWQRFVVSIAGALMNFVLALVISLIMVSFSGYTEAVVDSVVSGSPSEQAGLQAGDKIVKVDNYSVNSFSDLAFKVNVDGDEPLSFKIIRDGKTITKQIQPVFNEENNQYLIGIRASRTLGLFEKENELTAGMTRAGFFDSVSAGFNTMTYYVKVTFVSISKLVTLQLGVDKLTGPIGVTGIINEQLSDINKPDAQGHVATFGKKVGEVASFAAMLCAMMSANIGIFNLLPLPALDGGRCVFLIIEAIRRKPVNPEKEGLVHFIGLVLFMILAVFVAFSDILKII